MRKEKVTSLFMDVLEAFHQGAMVQDVVGVHRADLEAQDQYAVRYLRYRVDEKDGAWRRRPMPTRSPWPGTRRAC